MNIVFISSVVILLIGNTENAFVQHSEHNRDVEGVEQRILFRKLQVYQDDDKQHSKSVTWNEILADVLVNRMILSLHKDKDSYTNNNDEVAKENFVTKTVGQVLYLYKTYVHDKFISNTKQKVNKDVEDNQNPYKEVEIIEAVDQEEICTNCKETNGDSDDVSSNCQEGKVKDDEGNCVDKSMRYITKIPGQCPAGYKLDSIGHCRKLF